MVNKEAFLQELSELTKKYGVAIDGCGCCDSPYLTEKVYSYESSSTVNIDNTGKYIEDDGSIKWKQ